MASFRIIQTQLFLISFWLITSCYQALGQVDSFRVYDDVKITIDKRSTLRRNKPTIITFFALPNGNTTEQTMGKKPKPGDDWHFDIQHIRAQTMFIRAELVDKNFIVIYLENNYKSWPAWKQKHPDFKTLIPRLVDSLADIFPGKKKSIYLNGHSGNRRWFYFWIPCCCKTDAA